MRWSIAGIIQILLPTLLLSLPLQASLRDISPRPQQMGMLPGDPVFLLGTPHLVIPDNPTPGETVVYQEAVQLFADIVNREVLMDTWSQYSGQLPAIWLGTFARFPQLTAALDSSGIAGLGSATHSEEYQLLVQDNRLLLGGSDLRALRWGLQSLEVLMVDIMGQLSVDRVYIRDWPDLGKRITTVNTPVRNSDQSNYANLIVDAAYPARLNEIEWNDRDSGLPNRRSYPVEQSLLLATKIRNYGMLLTMSCDQTAYDVTELSWQEGIPIQNTPMRVTSSGFTVIPGGYGFQIRNGGFESWSGNRPADWSMYREDRYSYLQRDNAIRHSGSSSAKFTNFTGAPCDSDLRQIIYPGLHRAYKVVFWYKTSAYKGSIRILDLGQTDPNNKTNQFWINFNSATTQDWTRFELEFFSFYLDSVLLLIGPNCPQQGTLWLDDISVEAIEPHDMIRRNDTPVEVYNSRSNQLMTEGIDYRIVETSDSSYSQFVAKPRFERISGGRLAVNDTVKINWSWAPLFENKRRTQCFSLVEPLIEYQDRVARLDSFLHPDGFKIHINEVSYAGFDLNCTRRNMTPAQLVGSYCRQMYQIIQARRLGVPVRIYGDAFDIFVFDPRAMPVTTRTWTVGALQELPEAIEVMAMASYTSNLDSSMQYFADNDHQTVASFGLFGGFNYLIESVIAASHYPSCQGIENYLWYGNEDELRWKMAEFGNASWNMGPYIIFNPLEYSSRPDSLLFACEAWSDTFYGSYSPQITGCTLHYRLHPGGNWTSLQMASGGRDQYSGVLRNIGTSITEVEYYVTVADNRNLVSFAPADAPQTTFIVSIPLESGQSGGVGGEEIQFSMRSMPGFQLLEWNSVADAAWYEIHRGLSPDLGSSSQTLAARQSPECPRYLLTTENSRSSIKNPIHVFVIRESLSVPPREATVSRR